MTNEDIIGGLRNAIVRGQTLQQAMQSFINAGYAKEDVEEAARNIRSNQSSSSILSPFKPLQQLKPVNNSGIDQQTVQITPSGRSKNWIIILLILIVVFGASIGIFFLYGDKILKALGI